MLTVPSKTAPLAKAVRTIEGITATVVNIALVVATAVPTAHFSAKEAALYAAINNGLLIASRTLLKVSALSSAAGLPPIPLTVPGTLLTAAGGAAGTAIGDVIGDLNATPSLATAEAQADSVISQAQAAAVPPTN